MEHYWLCLYVMRIVGILLESLIGQNLKPMKLVYGLPEPINEQSTVLTVGVFDGVHLGHQYLISHVVDRARSHGYQSAVLTFDPHPDLIIHPEQHRLYLTSLEERIELIAALGVDVLAV